MCLRKLAVLGVIALVASGCATFSDKRRPMVARIADGDYERALGALQKVERKNPNLVDLMDRGTILHLLRDYPQSNQTLGEAERKIEDLFAKSVSREASTYLINDIVQEYSGEHFERIWVNILMGFNYIALGDLEDALVEIRKIDLHLVTYASEFGAKSSYLTNPFANYVSGMVHEAGGEINDAHISYRKALEGYETHEKLFGLPIPETLKRDLLRTSRKMGFLDELAKYETKFGVTFQEAAPRKKKEVIFLLALGKIAHKEEAFWSVDAGRNILRVAYPVYKESSFRTRRAQVHLGDQVYEAELVENLSQVAKKNLANRIDAIKARAIARMVAKAAASAAAGAAVAESTDDEALGAAVAVLTNVLLSQTERADTRSWLSLPAEMHLVRALLDLDQAPAAATIHFMDGAGKDLYQEKIALEISKPGTQFIWMRAKEKGWGD